VRVATAGAVALLLREAANLPAAGYDTREYLHGPLEAAGPDRAVLLFGSGREVRLAAELAGYGARVVLVTDGDASAPGLHVVRRPAAAGLAGCVLDILPVQLATAVLAERTGRVIRLRRMPADTKLGGDPGAYGTGIDVVGTL
jgi:glucosamine--fructose-6-phosphate aminotransferase (isomerizing)